MEFCSTDERTLWNAQSSTLDSRVRRTTRDIDDAERYCCLTSSSVGRRSVMCDQLCVPCFADSRVCVLRVVSDVSRVLLQTQLVNAAENINSQLSYFNELDRISTVSLFLYYLSISTHITFTYIASFLHILLYHSVLWLCWLDDLWKVFPQQFTKVLMYCVTRRNRVK